MSEPKPTAAPVTEPVLAQIPRGAPGRAYWFGIGALIWVLWFGVLAAISRWLGLSRSPPASDALLILGSALAFAMPRLLHPWLQAAVMRRLGAPTRLHRSSAHWIPVAERPLPRRAAVAAFLLPQFALVLIGLGAMGLGWFWAAIFVATAAAAFTPERALAARVWHDPGCTSVHLRRDGVVLYGTGRGFRPVPVVVLWVTSLVMGAGWMLIALLSGRGLILAVANTALDLRSRRDIIPFRYQPQTLRSRHQIWVRGPRLRIEVTSEPPQSPNLPEWPTADLLVTDPDTGARYAVPDGHALISVPDGTFLLQRGGRQAVRVSPTPIRLSGGIPSLPDIDRTRLSRWQPGDAGAARIGGYRTEIYEGDGWIDGQQSSTRLWLSPDLPVPVRIEERLPHEEREETVRSIRFDLPLPERLFRLPAGTIVPGLHPRRQR